MFNKKRVFSLLRFCLFVLLGVVVFVLSYLLLAYLFSRITVNEDLKQKNKPITCYILSNGVHTDLVVPAKNQVMDWKKFVSPKNTLKQDSTGNYVAFGWGDKGFYLNTPKWEDLTFNTAFSAAFGLSSSAIHTTYYYELEENDTNCKKIQLSVNNYKKMVRYIKKSFRLSKQGQPVFIPTKAIYGEHDAFYDAQGVYSLFQTCNSWANSGLKAANQKAALWTAFQGGIFCHYEE
jgi:uncharacterized protein (TIGR02117 family)